MPGFDRTGPWGRGPRTGWGRGLCGAGFRRTSGSGRGQGFRGRGWWPPPIMSLGGPPRWGYGPWGFGISVSGRRAGYASPEDEITALREEAAYLEGELEAIKRRLAEMESSPS
jgi:hypothetical protein